MTPAQLALLPALPAPERAPEPAARPSRPGADRIVAELHERHADELLRFCTWVLKDPDEAADALQDTWIRALASLRDDGLRVAAHRPWLFAIARNACLDRLRSRKREAIQAAEDDEFGTAPGADEVVELRTEANAALALVGSLSERQRTALLMRELAGMSMPEIASALGVTVERAHWTVADARRSLETARAGATLACEDIRDRLEAGHRNRSLRGHLDRCDGCRAHDRRLRARRLLAPVLLPVLWVRRLLLPALGSPSGAATMAAVVLAAGGPPEPAATRQEPARTPAAVAAVAAVAVPHADPVAAPRTRTAPQPDVRRPARPAAPVAADPSSPAAAPHAATVADVAPPAASDEAAAVAPEAGERVVRPVVEDIVPVVETIVAPVVERVVAPVAERVVAPVAERASSAVGQVPVAGETAVPVVAGVLGLAD